MNPWCGLLRELWEKRWLALTGAVVGGGSAMLLGELIYWWRQ